MSSNQIIKNGNTAQPYMKKPIMSIQQNNKMMTDQRNGGNAGVALASGGGNTAKYNKLKEEEKALSNRKVFVGGLTSNTTKDHLVEYFSKFGGVEDANIKIDTSTNRSRGYGFVLFESKEVAEQVLSTAEHVIQGKSVDVKTAKYKGAPPVKKIFIGGLDPNFPESELREYFSQYGKIEDIELPFDKQKNQRRSFCFILFENEESVNEILKKPKHVLGGKEVDVKKATPPKDQAQQNALLQPQWNQVQNWNMPNSQYFAGDPSAQGYGASNFGGLYNAPNSFGAQPNNYNATGFSKYNYQQPTGYPQTAYENPESAGYVDYDDPTAYDYGASGNMPMGAGYDQFGYGQNQMNGSYDSYAYDQSMYGQYSAPEHYGAAPQTMNPSKSSSGHHSYGGKMSKRSSQSQSYHPYNR